MNDQKLAIPSEEIQSPDLCLATFTADGSFLVRDGVFLHKLFWRKDRDTSVSFQIQ